MSGLYQTPDQMTIKENRELVKFKVKLSIEVTRSNALEKALSEFIVVSNDQSETDVVESADETVPFGFSSPRIKGSQ